MYSEKLEQLIQMAIADGVVTEKERSVLHKKAAAEGVDEDEIDLYIDGLLTQKTAEAPAKPEHKYDLTKCNKVHDSYCVYYEMRKRIAAVGLPANSKMTNVSVSFLKVIEAPGILEEYRHNYEDGLFIVVTLQAKYCISDEGNHSINTDKSSVPLAGEKTEIIENESRYGKATDNYVKCYVYRIDEDILDILCNAKDARLKIENARLHEPGNYKNQITESYNLELPLFSLYAQSAYNTLIDNTKYTKPMAMFTGEDKQAPAMTAEERSRAAGLLEKDTKMLLKDGEDKPGFKAYTDQQTNTTICHFSEKKSLRGEGPERTYDFKMTLHAISAAGGKHDYFLCLTSECRAKREEDGTDLPKIPFNLTEGALHLSMAGKTVTLEPLTKDLTELSGRNSWSNGDEHCYYAVPATLAKMLMSGGSIQVSVSGGDITVNAKTLFGTGKDMQTPNSWAEGYTLLENPDQKAALMEQYEARKARNRKYTIIGIAVAVLLLLMMIMCS